MRDLDEIFDRLEKEEKSENRKNVKRTRSARALESETYDISQEMISEDEKSIFRVPDVDPEDSMRKIDESERSISKKIPLRNAKRVGITSPVQTSYDMDAIFDQMRQITSKENEIFVTKNGENSQRNLPHSRESEEA
jgi:hypothetical protein